MGTNYLGELLGLQTALSTIAFESVPLPHSFHVFIDCTAAMYSAAGTCDPIAYHEVIHDIEVLIDFLEEGGCKTHLHWTPSHINISLNDIVDGAAKQAAVMARDSFDPPYCTTITLKDVKRDISRAVTNRWQRRWDRDHCMTRSFIPKVTYHPIPANLTAKAEACIAGCITGHNRLNNHLFKLKLKPSPDCSCKKGRQTAEHVLLSCPLYNEARARMHDRIELAYVKHDVPTHKRICSLSNLLTPKHDTTTNCAIAKALEEFLLAIKINI
jgi:hypothetical protein